MAHDRHRRLDIRHRQNILHVRPAVSHLDWIHHHRRPFSAESFHLMSHRHDSTQPKDHDGLVVAAAGQIHLPQVSALYSDDIHCFGQNCLWIYNCHSPSRLVSVRLEFVPIRKTVLNFTIYVNLANVCKFVDFRNILRIFNVNLRLLMFVSSWRLQI